ncbi:hypothetical protein SCH01S_51_01430 [Sphingomonas changbaiensis NBRC 104936]|uniref:Uncharacterized protein n=1 Tax=Sphingomonas changbaiensis NBRC 104936 TaxID=1219043 RepID=A0A0E9MUI8_9SPHN|nr:hypothetical protein SCH01S_51_01430 [Sphingomonas changbaiensis NBRC 104936]
MGPAIKFSPSPSGEGKGVGKQTERLDAASAAATPARQSLLGAQTRAPTPTPPLKGRG